jgi:tetratricopeptide (TPR) repeat protein
VWRAVPAADLPHGLLAEVHALLGEGDSVRRYRRLEEAARPPESRGLADSAWWDAAEAEADGRWAAAASAYSGAAETIRSCMPCLTFYAAYAWDRAGQADSAEAYYRAGVDAPVSDDGPEDAIFYPLALRRLGEFAEARGERAAALRHYERFVDLWRDADAELQPQVAQARERMKSLLAEPRPPVP